jgi:hypothetical protein
LSLAFDRSAFIDNKTAVGPAEKGHPASCGDRRRQSDAVGGATNVLSQHVVSPLPPWFSPRFSLEPVIAYNTVIYPIQNESQTRPPFPVDCALSVGVAQGTRTDVTASYNITTLASAFAFGFVLRAEFDEQYGHIAAFV